jgi:hypothetical protein
MMGGKTLTRPGSTSRGQVTPFRVTALTHRFDTPAAPYSAYEALYAGGVDSPGPDPTFVRVDPRSFIGDG